MKMALMNAAALHFTNICYHLAKFSGSYMNKRSGFGGLGVACWPLVPKFAGSNPAEAVGF